MKALLLFITLLWVLYIHAQQNMNGMYLDSTNKTYHTCPGREANEIHIGISLPNDEYFIYLFGRAWYQVPNNDYIVGIMIGMDNQGIDMGDYYLNRSSSDNNTWISTWNVTSGPHAGIIYTNTLINISPADPEEEFCIKPAPQPNPIYGIWEWIEPFGTTFQLTRGVFYPDETNSTLVRGCWGYVDGSLTGDYSGEYVFENRGWIGSHTRNGTTSALFFMRIGNKNSQTKIVGYFFLGSQDGDNPVRGLEGQILSNSLYPANPGADDCPIAPNSCSQQNVTCPACNSCSTSSASSLSSFLTS